MMNPLIKTLRILGFWSHPDHDYSPRRAIFLIFAVIVCILIPGLGFILRQEPTFATFMRNLIETLIIGNVVPQATIFLIHRTLLEKTYTEIKSTLQEVSSDPHRDVQTMLRNLDKFSKWVFKIYIVIEIVMAVPYFLSVPITTTIKYIRTGELPPLQGIFEADYLLFDFQSNFWSWLATCIVTLSVTLHLIIFLLIKGVCPRVRCAELPTFTVSMKMVRLDEFSDDQLRRKEWVEIVQLQEVAYRCARNLEEVLNVFMLILYGEFIFELCMALVTLALSNDDRDMLVKMIVVSMYNLLHIFIYSLLGTELISAANYISIYQKMTKLWNVSHDQVDTFCGSYCSTIDWLSNTIGCSIPTMLKFYSDMLVQSTATANAIFATRWYQLPVEEQRNVLFALGRSQKMAALTTGKFFHIQRSTFGMALRTALSYYAVLRHVYGSE